MSLARSLIPRIAPVKTALFVCDMQNAFRNHAVKFNEVSQICKRLLDTAALLDMKIIATEQYPKGLGHTIPELELQKYKVPVYEKTKFSMCVPEVAQIFGKQVDSVLLCGIECHVCILHSALDMLERGIQVHVVADAVTSRTKTDRLFGLRQMERAGAILTTSECAILGLVGASDHPKFKEIQKLIKTAAPDTDLITDFSQFSSTSK